MDEHVAITTPDHVTLQFELAGLGSRFAAMAIDTLLIALVVAAVALIGLMLAGGAWGLSSWAGSVAAAVLVLIGFAVMWGYFVAFETVLRGQTPGKRALGIRVVRDDALPIGLRESAIRNLVRIADLLPPPSGLLGGIVASADARGRRLGDMAAGTIVIRERFAVAANVATAAAWAARVERGQSRHALSLPRGTVSPTQLTLIEQFMGRRFDLPPPRRAELAFQIVAPLLPIVGADPAAVAASPVRGALCEQILGEILDLARNPDSRQAVTVEPVAAAEQKLF